MLVIDRSDNVAVALGDIQKGDIVTIRTGDGVEKIMATEDIPFGHKIALRSLAKDEAVYKYGEEIGRMKTAVTTGGWIHSHNMYCDRGLK